MPPPRIARSWATFFITLYRALSTARAPVGRIAARIKSYVNLPRFPHSPPLGIAEKSQNISSKQSPQWDPLCALRKRRLSPRPPQPRLLRLADFRRARTRPSMRESVFPPNRHLRSAAFRRDTHALNRRPLGCAPFDGSLHSVYYRLVVLRLQI